MIKFIRHYDDRNKMMMMMMMMMTMNFTDHLMTPTQSN